MAIALAVVLCWMISGCVSGPLTKARKSFYDGNPSQAVETLSEADPMTSRDKLLFHMEKGLILHDLGRYEDSNTEFIAASELIERQDIISISQQTASVVTSEWVTEFKGEYSDRLWTHTYLMMNFLLLNKYESAYVEARKALKVMQEFGDPLSEDLFTRTLIAHCFDLVGEKNDAYIEYQKVAARLPDPAPVSLELHRLAKDLGLFKEAEDYKKWIPESLIFNTKSSNGELIVFACYGRGPTKVAENIVVPPSIRFSLPAYQDRSHGGGTVAVFDTSRRLPSMTIQTNVNAVARASLNTRKKTIIAKETARVAAKEAIVQSVRHNNKNNEVLTALLRIAFFLMEEPDTRSWETLPASMQFVKTPLTPGEHDIRIAVHGDAGIAVEDIRLPRLKIRKGQRVYRSVRIR